MCAALALAACTTDADPLCGPTPDADPRLIEINIGPKPQFSPTNHDGTPADEAGHALPGTRVTQTDAAAEWVEGDVVWVRAEFNAENIETGVSSQFAARTALIYDQGTWRSLTEEEVGSLVPAIQSEYKRTLRWPEEAFGKPDSYCDIKAAYAGNKTPDDRGKVTLIDTDCPLSKVNLIEADPISFKLGEEPPTLQFKQSQVRIRLTKACDAKIISFDRVTSFYVDYTGRTTDTYSSPSAFLNRLPAGDYFCQLTAASRLEINNVSITFLPRTGDTYDGLSYTIDPDALTNGPVTPI